jgi:hypothetical protein
MSTDQAFADAPTRELEPIGEADPLAKVTLTPRGFAAVLAAAALLLGLVLALLPVHVAGPDPAHPNRVSCGNTVGGVETDVIGTGLGSADRQTVVSYVNICEQAMGERVFYSWPLFLAGGLGIIWLGVVRTRAQRAGTAASAP